jgi:hypothetical protein
MGTVYINDIHYISMPQREVKTPRERYVTYFEDLYKSYGKILSPETFKQGGQYTFAELGETVLDDKLDDEWMKDVDLLLPTYWSYEFDPEYSSCGPFFQEKYALKGQLFDVSEQGTLAGLTGLHIMQRYLCNGSHYHKGILLALEQTTIPRYIPDQDIVPQRNAGCGMVIQDHPLENKALYLRDVLHFSNDAGYLEVILDVLRGLPPSLPKTVFIKKNSNYWKALKFKTDLPFKMEFIEPDVSMLSLFESLYHLFHDHHFLPGIYLFVEEDVESFQSGILIIEKVGICI